MTQILLATHNPSKIKRIKTHVHLENIDFITPKDLNLKITEPKEDGQSELENSKIKATAYFEVAQIPSLALDTGFYMHNLPENQQPGKDVQSSAGVNPGDDDETRYQKMLNFYQNLVKPFGLETPAYFKDVYCLFDGTNYWQETAIREVILTTTEVGKDVHFPIASIFKIPSLNKHYHDLSPEEMLDFIQPSLEAVSNIIAEFTSH